MSSSQPVTTQPPPELEAALATLPGAVLRPVSDADAPQLIALVEAAFDEYPGCVLDLPGLDHDLVAPATTAASTGTYLWVVEDAGPGLAACVGLGPVDDSGTAELKRLYVSDTHRRRGLARGLVAWVEAVARDLGATAVDLWSDTRFVAAHHLYGGLGYVATGQHRDLHDPSNTTERHFRRELDDATGPTQLT